MIRTLFKRVCSTAVSNEVENDSGCQKNKYRKLDSEYYGPKQ
jgi:hypothetical protein